MARQAERPPIISDKYRMSINNLYLKLKCFPTYTLAYCLPDQTQTWSSIMTPDRRFGRRAGSCLLVLGSVYIQVFTYKWRGQIQLDYCPEVTGKKGSIIAILAHSTQGSTGLELPLFLQLLTVLVVYITFLNQHVNKIAVKIILCFFIS